jgi:hypothetical protein
MGDAGAIAGGDEARVDVQCCDALNSPFSADLSARNLGPRVSATTPHSIANGRIPQPWNARIESKYLPELFLRCANRQIGFEVVGGAYTCSRQRQVQ